ncbi:MAG: PTS glucose transporter subunit IIA [Clostridia bacterium]|nr:PTS glucose transporter subunit IIA [Clostridia bacterium]
MLFSKKKSVLLAVADGEVLPLSQVEDEAFSSGMLGRGIAIKPSSGSIYSPADVTVVGIAESGHAYTLESADGLELLIHIGIDTVGLGGKGFLPMVGEGDTVKAGELLCRVDLQAIRDAGLSTVIPFLITNPEITKELKPTQAASAIGGQSVILEYRL